MNIANIKKCVNLIKKSPAVFNFTKAGFIINQDIFDKIIAILQIPKTDDSAICSGIYKILLHFPTILKRLKRGEVIRTPFTYRNEGIIGLFNTTGIVPLDYNSADDYGSVPSEFVINTKPGYPVTEWQGKIDHNNIVWFDLSKYRDEIRETYKKINKMGLFQFNGEFCILNKYIPVAKLLSLINKQPIALNLNYENISDYYEDIKVDAATFYDWCGPDKNPR